MIVHQFRYFISMRISENDNSKLNAVNQQLQEICLLPNFQIQKVSLINYEMYQNSVFLQINKNLTR